MLEIEVLRISGQERWYLVAEKDLLDVFSIQRTLTPDMNVYASRNRKPSRITSPSQETIRSKHQRMRFWEKQLYLVAGAAEVPKEFSKCDAIVVNIVQFVEHP